jgi:hypothetical protein
VAKKIGKNLEFPLTEAGLLMEDAETPRNQFSAALGGVSCRTGWVKSQTQRPRINLRRRHPFRIALRARADTFFLTSSASSRLGVESLPTDYGRGGSATAR